MKTNKIQIKWATTAAFTALGVGLLINAATLTGAQAPPPVDPAIIGTSAPIAGSWSVDPAHTNVTFAIKHMGISLVRGRFDDIAGAIVADPDHLDKSSVQFTIQSTSIDTNVKMRDDDLRSATYFDVAKYPTITFQSTKIEKKKRDYVAYGNLTIHGVTKPIALPFTVSGPIHDPFGGVRFGILTNIHLSRLDYGVGAADKFSTGVLAIGDDVDVAISLEGVPAK
jgi:polyisoprenoid-binding protein YceI